MRSIEKIQKDIDFVLDDIRNLKHYESRLNAYDDLEELREELLEAKERSNNIKTKKLEKGMTCWYVDTEFDIIQKGTIIDIDYKEDSVDYFTIHFKSGEVFNFSGLSWGNDVFESCEEAVRLLTEQVVSVDMDYKEFLERKDFSSPQKIAEWMEDAIKIITELVSKNDELKRERDEAIKYLKGFCPACKNCKPHHNIGLCKSCKYEYSWIPDEKRKDNWEWIGGKEE